MERLTEKRNCEIFFYGPVYCKFSNENYIQNVLKREVKSPCYKDEYYNGGFVRETSLQQIYRKLGQLEDIEEELGIELVILSKALKNGVYYDAGNKTILYHKAEGEEYIDIHIPHQYLSLMYVGPYYDCCYCKMNLAYKDYGKTWALTKEELKEEKID